MIIKIVGAGQNHFANIYTKEENEFIIGVDGGLNALLELDITADVAIGDFDSFDQGLIKAREIIKYDSKKNFSDLALALERATQIKHQEIIIYNVTGNRLDHFYSVINELVNYSDYNIQILDEKNRIYLRNKEFTVYKDNYKYVSFFAIEDVSITLENFLYPLNNYQLKRFDNLCLSNEVIDNEGIVKVSGTVLVIQSN